MSLEDIYKKIVNYLKYIYTKEIPLPSLTTVQRLWLSQNKGLIIFAIIWIIAFFTILYFIYDNLR